MTLEIFLWQVNFCTSGNFFKGSTFPVAPFRLVQFMVFKTLRAQFSVSSRPPPSSFNIPENVKTKILMLQNLCCLRPDCVNRRCIQNFFLDCMGLFFHSETVTVIVRSCVPETEKAIKVLILKMQKLYLDHLLLQLRFQWPLTSFLTLQCLQGVSQR